MKKSVFLGLFFYAIAVSTAFAQEIGSSDAAATVVRREQLEDYMGLESKLEEAKAQYENYDSYVDSKQKEAKKKASILVQTFEVKKIIFTKSYYLREKELTEIAAKYENKSLRLSDIYELVDEVNALYRSKNVLTAMAFLPPQKIKDGMLEIRLLEGRVGAVQTRGNISTKDDYILKRLDIKEGQRADMSSLEHELYKFNRQNDITLRAVLKPGSQAGLTNYVLAVQEPKRWNISLFSDNAGSSDTGLMRVGTGLSLYSMLGIRDKFNIGFVHALGVRNIYGSYSMPLNRYGTIAGISLDFAKTKIIAGQLKSLKIEGHSSSFSAFVSHPLVFTRSFTMNVFGGMSTKRSSTSYDDFTVVATRLRTVNLGFDLQYISKNSVFDFKNYITNGLKRRGGEYEYFKYNFEFSSLTKLFKKMRALSRVNFQYTDTDNLQSSEQMQLGGMATVRGYTEGLLIGDNGLFASLELSHPFFFKGLDIFAFFDHGVVFNAKRVIRPLDPINDNLSGVGMGFTYQHRNNLFMKLALGIPLDRYEEVDTAESILHANMQLNF